MTLKLTPRALAIGYRPGGRSSKDSERYLLPRIPSMSVVAGE